MLVNNTTLYKHLQNGTQSQLFAYLQKSELGEVILFLQAAKYSLKM